MLEVLHDAVDSREELKTRAEEIVDRVISDHLEEAVESTDGDIEQVMLLLTELIEDELSTLTTEAVAIGADNSIKRRAASDE